MPEQDEPPRQEAAMTTETYDWDAIVNGLNQ